MQKINTFQYFGEITGYEIVRCYDFVPIIILSVAFARQRLLVRPSASTDVGRTSAEKSVNI